MSGKLWLNADDVRHILGRNVSRSWCGKCIRELNARQEQAGHITYRGKVNRYVLLNALGIPYERGGLIV